jgi:hypothetical protein
MRPHSSHSVLTGAAEPGGVMQLRLPGIAERPRTPPLSGPDRPVLAARFLSYAMRAGTADVAQWAGQLPPLCRLRLMPGRHDDRQADGTPASHDPPLALNVESPTPRSFD